MLEMGSHHGNASSPENLGYSSEALPVLIDTVNKSIIQIFNRSLDPNDQKTSERAEVPHIGTFKNQSAMLSAAKHFIHDSLRSRGITLKKKMRTAFQSMRVMYKKYAVDIDQNRGDEAIKKKNLAEFKARMESGAVAEDIVSCLLIMHIFGSQGQQGLPWTVEILLSDNATMTKFTEGNRHADRALRQIMRTAKILLPQIYLEHEGIIEVFEQYIFGLMQKILDREFIDFSGRFNILDRTSTGAVNTRDAHGRTAKAY